MDWDLENRRTTAADLPASLSPNLTMSVDRTSKLFMPAPASPTFSYPSTLHDSPPFPFSLHFSLYLNKSAAGALVTWRPALTFSTLLPVPLYGINVRVSFVYGMG